MKLARLTACAAVLACTGAAPAAAYVTPEQAQQAVDETVAWYGTQQDASGNVGFFGGDWSMIALANAGKSAADLRLSAGDPSLQDYFAADWAFASPFDVSTDQSRKLLAGRGGGIQTARLNQSQNIVANQMTFFDGSQMGNASQVNDDMFALLAGGRRHQPTRTPSARFSGRCVPTGRGGARSTSCAPPRRPTVASPLGRARTRTPSPRPWLSSA